MKKLCLICLLVALFSLKSLAAVPDGAIPFIVDGHLYLKSTLNDTIPVTVSTIREPTSFILTKII